MLNIFLAYYKKPNIALRNRLVELNLGLARGIAHKISQDTKEHYEDLEQVAMLGLIAAVERFNPTIGLQFSTFAVPTIQGKVLQYLRDKSTTIRIPQNLQDLFCKINKIQAALALELGRNPTKTEIASRASIKVELLEEIEHSRLNRFPLSLSQSNNEDSGDRSCTFEQLIASPQISLPTEDLPTIPDTLTSEGVYNQDKELINQLFLQNKTAKDAANSLGISPTTIKRRLRHAVELELRLQRF